MWPGGRLVARRVRPISAVAEICTGGRATAAPEIGNCRNQLRGSHDGCARNRQLPKFAPGLGVRTKTLASLLRLQPQWFPANYRTYCRFSTPTSKRNLPMSSRGAFSATSRTFSRGSYSRRRFQPQGVIRSNYQPCIRNRQLPKSAPGIARVVRQKSAIAEISSGGRTTATSEIGSCRNQHQGSHEGCAQNDQQSRPISPLFISC